MGIYDFSQPVTSDLVLMPHYGAMLPTLETVKTVAMDGASLAQLKTIFPIGSELPDSDPTNSLIDNPWVIAHYEVVADADGVSRNAVAIIRKFLNSTATNIGTDDVYGSSTERTYLEGTYWNGCSQAAKNAISPVKMTFLQNVAATPTIFLPSATNLCLATITQYPSQQTNGEMWELFGAQADNSALEIRKCALGSNQTSFQTYITRDNYPSTGPHKWYYSGVNADGAFIEVNDDSTTTTYLRPAAYILGAQA